MKVLTQLPKVVLLSSLSFLLVSCGEVNVPVSGYIGTERALGNAKATMEAGTFEASTVDGLECKGSYDSIDTAISLKMDVSCNDGRKGLLIVRRTPDLMSGTAIGKLSDGTRGEFVFGNLTFEQAFGASKTKIR